MLTNEPVEKIAVFGAGGHAKVVIDAILRSPHQQLSGVFDDDPAKHGDRISGQAIVGDREALRQFIKKAPNCRFVVALGDNRTRRDVSLWLTNNECLPAIVVHPQASVAAGVAIGPGSVVFAHTVVGPDARLGEGTIVNSGAVVEHDCVVGDFAHIAPHATLCGGVTVGREALIGAGAVVLPGKRVGERARVGAQATVIADVAEGTAVVGTPAQVKPSSAASAATKSQAATSDPPQIRSWSPWPCFSEDEIEATARVLRSGKVNYWTGDECRKFETEFAVAVDRRHAIALANGTLALELALQSLDIGAGAEVITTPRTFIASASCAVMRGAKPVFADVDLDSQNISAESISRVLTPRTRALIVVHLAGRPCDMDPILELARRHDLRVIEDCAQAQGARYKGRPVGSFGDFAAFSFCQDKIMTTGGEGGMLVTDDDELWNRAWSYKDHGKSYDAVYHRRHELGFRWLHESFGTNWRMTEMQGALGRVQLPKVAGWLRQRQAHASRLTEHLRDLPTLRIPSVPENVDHAFYKYYVFVEPKALLPGWTRDRIMTEMVAEDIPCYTGTCGEIYLERAFETGESGSQASLPNARLLSETGLMFPVHPTLTTEEIDRIGKTARRVLQQACRQETAAARKSPSDDMPAVPMHAA